MARLIAGTACLLLPTVSGTLDVGLGTRALAGGDRLVHCNYNASQGIFPTEDLWQSGNTIETLANLMLATGSTRWANLIANTYSLTGDILDNCYDDHQWWGIAWVRAYQAAGELKYLTRAGVVFDDTAKKAWTTAPCGGGILWCPTGNPYKNAITNELFLTSAMELHPYAGLLGKPADYYLNWAVKEWNWLANSGMINSRSLVNDGVTGNGAVCRNNDGTTWTYNQGVLLSGLGLLAAATGNATIQTVAENVARATFQYLTNSDSILQEPCSGTCDGDQHIFKGVFMRHLGYLASRDPAFAAASAPILTANAVSILANASCPGGWYGLKWEGPCDLHSTATTSAAVDALLAAALVPQAPPPVGTWAPIGLGGCTDAKNATMPACYSNYVDEAGCAAVAGRDAGAVAYDFYTSCSGTSSLCRVRTSSGPPGCATGFVWQAGTGATTVTQGDAEGLTVCVARVA